MNFIIIVGLSLHEVVAVKRLVYLDEAKSYDPGSTAVLESIFHLNPPLPMNFYIDRYNGEVLVIQVWHVSSFTSISVFDALPSITLLRRHSHDSRCVQGVRDPLHNATKRAAVLRANCVANITTRFLNAGHCPHDEVPDEVNALIHDWLRCSSTNTTLDTANLESQFLTNEDAAGIVKGDSRLIKSDWFSYFSR